MKKRQRLTPTDNRTIPGPGSDASVYSEPATGSDIGQPRDTGSQDPLQLSTGSQDPLSFTETMEQYEARIADRCEVGKGCCALRILEAEEDFRNEISLLETIIQAAGHEVIFYPKFHCELNYIEYYWAALKRYTRDNCQYSFAAPEPTVLRAMGSIGLGTIQRFGVRSKS